MGGRQGAAGGERKRGEVGLFGVPSGRLLRQARAGGKRKERLLALGFSLRYNKKQPYFEGESHVRFRPLYLSQEAQRQGASSGAFARSGCKKDKKSEGRYRS